MAATISPAKSVLPESKESRFRRLANRRVNAAIKHLRYVRNLANRGTYAYTTEQSAKVVATLEREVALVKQAFSGGAAANDQFSL